jgi:hypothetical protein
MAMIAPPSAKAMAGVGNEPDNEMGDEVRGAGGAVARRLAAAAVVVAGALTLTWAPWWTGDRARRRFAAFSGMAGLVLHQG